MVLENCIGLRIRLKAYVLDTHYEKMFETDITLRVQDAFRDHGIGPPAVLHRRIAGGAESDGEPGQDSSERPGMEESSRRV